MMGDNMNSGPGSKSNKIVEERNFGVEKIQKSQYYGDKELEIEFDMRNSMMEE